MIYPPLFPSTSRCVVQKINRLRRDGDLVMLSGVPSAGVKRSLVDKTERRPHSNGLMSVVQAQENVSDSKRGIYSLRCIDINLTLSLSSVGRHCRQY